MRNKEKSEQISQNHKNFYYIDDGTRTTSALECYHSAMEMAEWKDKEHKDKIDVIMLTTEGCLRSFFESQGNTQESIDNFIDALKTQITENLKKKDKERKELWRITRNHYQEWAIEQLSAFAVHLNKRGAFRDDLCMDFEHEAQSFIEMQTPKEL